MRYILAIMAMLVTAGSSGSDSDDRPADVRAVFKVSPKDVMRMRKAGQEHERAIYREIREIQEESDQVELTLSPGEETHHLNLLARAPTTISFVDATGTPWPIETVRGYDGDLFDVAKVENSYRNSAILYGKLPSGVSYFTVFLASLAEPITVRVNVSDSKYHKSRVLKIMKVGPSTELNLETAGMASQIGLPEDVDLNNVLFAVTPFEAKKLSTDNPAVLAWEKGGQILVRTNLKIFTPGHIRIKPGSNGYVAYRLPKTSRLYASNDAGSVVKIAIEEAEK